MAKKESGKLPIPDFPNSYWIESEKVQEFPQLNEDLDLEVAVVGGGITGITTAYMLAKEGLDVVLLEGDRLMNGTTGHTTAKVTAQHGLIYDELISHFGLDKAKQYYKANEEAARWIEQLINEHHIECDYRKESAYLYTSAKGMVEKLRNEASAYEKIGVKGGFTDSIPLPVEMHGAVEMKDQAQFHPLRYLHHLIGDMTENGGRIYEKSQAVKMEGNNPSVIKMKNGTEVRAKYVISASHFPFHDGKGYFARLYPKRSYVLVVKSNERFPGGMYITAGNPSRSFRSIQVNGEEMIMVIGDNHKTGQGVPEADHYAALERDAVKLFHATEVVYKWAAQDLVTPDNVPYIGRVSDGDPHVFVATGFRKWGMTHSTVAARILKDLIVHGESEYEELYKPSRFPADPSIKTFIKENANVAAHLVSGKLDRPDKEIKDLKNEEGAVVTIKGKRAGAYKNDAGELFVVDTTCTHLGCEVNWNSGDKSWDCPCHGSRFSYKGDVLEGPADMPLKKVEPNSGNVIE